jgi:uncharacterized membrane protein YsdA (DUF1294 family)/cold shock CspA family protein
MAMQFEGTLKTWHDDRGFGFIEPTQGGQEIFVHVKAFQGLRGRPQAGQRLSFEIELGPQGKKRAKNVAPVVARRPAELRSKRGGPARWRAATMFAIPAFVAVLLLAHVFGQPPRWSLAVYGAASVVTFLAYAIDKAAAQRGNARRTPERTLHTLALAGGWPGALLAQQFLRHKSSKAEFRSVFWATVVVNVVAFIVMATPQAWGWFQA